MGWLDLTQTQSNVKTNLSYIYLRCNLDWLTWPNPNPNQVELKLCFFNTNLIWVELRLMFRQLKSNQNLI